MTLPQPDTQGSSFRLSEAFRSEFHFLSHHIYGRVNDPPLRRVVG